jgi:hypothetical protein
VLAALPQKIREALPPCRNVAARGAFSSRLLTAMGQTIQSKFAPAAFAGWAVAAPIAVVATMVAVMSPRRAQRRRRRRIAAAARP